MARKTDADRREQEYRIENRMRERILSVRTWEEARSIQQEQPTSEYLGDDLIGEFRYYFAHLQRAVKRLRPYHLQEPDFAEYIPGGASADQLEMFKIVVPRLVTDTEK